MKIDFFSDKGNFRAENQDTIIGVTVDINNDKYYVLAVCDGMGGGIAGKEASATVCRHIKSYLSRLELKIISSPVDVVNVIQLQIYRAAKSANNEIYEKFSGTKKMSGTTLSAIILNEKYHSFVHVGDSRIYALKEDGDFIQLSYDDTWTNNEVKHGRLTEQEAKTHAKRHALIKAIGVKKSFDLHTSGIFSNDGIKLFFLTSDGYSEFLEDSHIFELMNDSSTLEDVALEMLKLGQKDNLSAIMVRL